MVLIGVFESPFVRRVAITLRLLGLPFEHRALCAVRNFDALCEVNPVGKAPTLITGEGDMLIDSTLIIDYAESLASPESFTRSGRACTTPRKSARHGARTGRG